MNEIVKIDIKQIGDEEVNAVNARDLWRALEINKDFSNWIKAQIESLGLEENIDYIVFAQKVENQEGGRPKIEYIITLDSAKHIAMASRTEKGREVRKYFIEVEKQWKKNMPSYMIADPIKRAERWIEEQKERMALERKIEEDKPKVEFANAIEVSVNSISIGNYAKMLSKENNVKIGQNKLFQWLRDNGYLIKDGRRRNFPKQKYIDNGYFEIKTNKVATNKGIREVHTTLITGRGQIALANRIINYFKGGRR